MVWQSPWWRDNDKPRLGSGRRIPISLRDPTLPRVPSKPCPECGGRQYFRRESSWWRGIWSIAGSVFRCYDCAPQGARRYPDIEEWWYVGHDIE